MQGNLFLILFLLIGSLNNLFGQTETLSRKCEKKYNEAKRLIRSNPEKALKSINSVIKKNAEHADSRLIKAGILSNLNRPQESIEELTYVIDNYGDTYPDAYRSRGYLYEKMEVYGRAAKDYEKYIGLTPKKKDKDRFEENLSRTKFRSAALKDEKSFNPKRLGNTLNTTNHEYIPQLTIDGNSLIFTRRVNGQEDLYVSQFDPEQQKYLAAEPMDDLNTPQNEGVHAITADGNRIVFTACNRVRHSLGSCDLFTSRRYLDKDGNYKWSSPKNMGGVINTGNWDAQPTISSDGRTLIWSSDRSHGKGGRDIWMSTRNKGKGWQDPVPLSDKINTKYDEESPFLHPDGNTLYFRSNRPDGMGGYDIFYSRYDRNSNTWSEAKNLGYPINTEYDEGALSVSADGRSAYFATDRFNKQNPNLDIYQFELYEEARPNPVSYIRLNVIDGIENQPLEAKVVLTDTEKSEEYIFTTDNSGTFLHALPVKKKYSFYVEKGGYLFYSDFFDLTDYNQGNKPFIIDVVLQPIVEEDVVIEESEPIVLNNIFFETGSDQLLPTSMPEIKKLYELLQVNPTSRIEISGHTDDVGTDEDNLKLSQARAQSVVSELVDMGIQSNRLVAQGYGEQKPIASNETEEGRKQNRRTEFKLIK